MRGQPTSAGPRTPLPESYFRLVLNLGSVVASVLVLAVVIPARPAPAGAGGGEAVGPAGRAARSRWRQRCPSRRTPPAPPVKELDRAAVANAEEALDEVTRDRARAEDRLAEARRLLGAATTQAAADAAASRQLAYRVRDPRAQIARLASQGGFIRAERDRLKEEVAAIKRAPRPKPKSIVDRNPVAKPADGEEYHLEIRHNRVTCIELERLIKLVKSDAQLRVRLADNQRVIESRVGPVGSFSMDLRPAPGVPPGSKSCWSDTECRSTSVAGS